MNGILASHWLVVGDMTVPRLACVPHFSRTLSPHLDSWVARLLHFPLDSARQPRFRLSASISHRYLPRRIYPGCLPLCRRGVCLHKRAGLLAPIAAHFDWRNRLRGSPGAAMARFGHFASRARNFLSPDCADRVHPVDPLPLGSLGNWSLASES